jgi:glutathione peroxidase-family protein
VLRVLGEDNEASNVPVNQMTQMENEPEPRIYDLTTGKYDVTVKVGPSFTTQRAEAAEQMMLLVQQFPQAAPVIGDLIAKNLDWPGAEEMAERLQKLLPGALQGADPEKEQMKAQLAEAAAIIQQLQADRSVLQQKNQIDANKVALDAQKVVVDKYRAETDRMEGLAKVQKDAPNVAMMEDFQPNNLI